MNDEQIKEVMRLADELADACAGCDSSHFALGQRAALEAYLRTIGEPAGYSLPAGSIGAKKFAQVGGGFTPVGLVFSRGESAMAITEHGRVYWDRDLVHPISGEPESVNAELLEALKSAKNGLEWYQDTYPESASKCDNEEMQEIDAAIARAESAIETPAKVSPCAGHAVQQEADEAKICATCRFLTKNGVCQSKGTSYNCVDYCQWEANEAGGA